MSKSIRHRHVFTFIWRYAKRHLWMLSLMILLLLLNTSLTLLQPFFYKEAVDTVATGMAGDPRTFKAAITFVLLGVGAGVISLTVHELASFLLGRFEVRVMKEAHVDVFAHVQRLSTKFHLNTFAGATSRKIGRGVDGIEGMSDILWFNFLPLIVFSIGLSIALALFAPIIGWAMIIGMTLYTCLSVFLNLKLARFFRWTDEQDTRVTASLVDTITGNAAVKAFSTESHEVKRHDTVISEWQRRQWISWRLSGLIAWIQFMLLMVIELAVLGLAVYLWYTGEFTAGGFVVVMFYVGQLWGRLHDIGRNVRGYLHNMAHCTEMVAIASEPLEVDDHPYAKDLQVQDAGIEMRNITFHYDAYHSNLFQGFTLNIQPQEKVALVGHSGSGKSTLIKLIMRLYDIQEGAILIDNQSIADVTQDSLRQSMSLVPQDPVLFHRTIRENIAYAAPDAADEEIERASKLAHAHEFIRELPAGYDTLVGERGVKLSGGERQRTAIARAILANKPILILDEATSSLDSVSEKLIQEALDNLMHDRTSIIVAHRLSTVRNCDRIAVLEKGKLIACAPHEELLETCETYRKMVELQSHGMLAE